MFDGRQKKETLREKERERARGNEGFLVEEAVKQEEKDERIKKGSRELSVAGTAPTDPDQL